MFYFHIGLDTGTIQCSFQEEHVIVIVLNDHDAAGPFLGTNRKHIDTIRSRSDARSTVRGARVIIERRWSPRQEGAQCIQAE
jgi:hypothetical protein